MYKYDVIWDNVRDKSMRSNISSVIEGYVEENLTIRSLATRYGCSYATINAILTKNGVSKKTFSEIQNTPEVQLLKKVPQKLVDPNELSRAIELYNSGESANWLAKRYGITVRGLIEKFKKNGVKLKTSTESANLPTTHERKKESYQDRYGVDNPMQDPTINERSNINRYKFKAVDIHGRRFSHLQGYEPQGIIYLIEQMGISVDEIQSGRKVPKIRYTFKDKRKMYFPDMFVESKNLLIEVKCDYTYNNMIELNKVKREASLNAGYDYLTIIFSNSGKEIIEIF